MLKKILFSMTMLTSASTIAQPQMYYPPAPDFSQANQLQAQSHQQMQQGLNQLFGALSNASKRQNYQRTGNHSYGSDGSNYYHNGGNTYGSNGVNNYGINDKSGYSSNGSTYNRVGDYTYINHPDGSRSVCYHSSVGVQCR